MLTPTCDPRSKTELLACSQSYISLSRQTDSSNKGSLTLLPSSKHLVAIWQANTVQSHKVTRGREEWNVRPVKGRMLNCWECPVTPGRAQRPFGLGSCPSSAVVAKKGFRFRLRLQPMKFSFEGHPLWGPDDMHLFFSPSVKACWPCSKPLALNWKRTLNSLPHSPECSHLTMSPISPYDFPKECLPLTFNPLSHANCAKGDI